MTNAIESIMAIKPRPLTQRELAERLRDLNRCMEPHIKVASRALAMFPPRCVFHDGQLVERTLDPVEQELIDRLGEIRNTMAKMLRIPQ
jgi:hypothetical protein